MSTTKLANIINPQVMGDMIEAKIAAMAKFTPYAKVDTSLQGTAGDTKTVPSWNYIGDAEDFNPETASDTDAEMSTTNLTAGYSTFSIKCAGKAVSILQTAINSGLGNPVGQAESQLAKSIIGKVDNDVLDAAYTGSVVYAPQTLATIGYAGIVDANAKFLDEEDGIERVMFINPAQEAALLKDSNFISADKFEAGVAIRGSIGKVAGAWIKKSKKVKKIAYTLGASGDAGALQVIASGSEGSTKVLASKCADTTWDGTNKKVVSPAAGAYVVPVASAYYLCPIIKLQPDNADTEYTEDELPAITIFLKKDTQVDHEWFPKKQKHDITAAKYYGVAKTNDAKIVLAEFLAQ